MKLIVAGREEVDEQATMEVAEQALVVEVAEQATTEVIEQATAAMPSRQRRRCRVGNDGCRAGKGSCAKQAIGGGAAEQTSVGIYWGGRPTRLLAEQAAGRARTVAVEQAGWNSTRQAEVEAAEQAWKMKMPSRLGDRVPSKPAMVRAGQAGDGESQERRRR
ncbi:hypothetical protein Dimus_026899 [Dionaea muscipula]